MLQECIEYLPIDGIEFNPESVLKFEKKYGVVFPESYKRLLKDCQGKTPNPNYFKFNNSFSSIAVFYHFYDNRDDINSYHIEKNQDFLREYVSPNLLAFAEDPGGNFICFDYRKGPYNPRVVFVSHEDVGADAIYSICKDFDKFLSSLYAG